MLAYHNDIKIKEKILKQLQLHYDADELIKGTYWENGKGCAVGCTIYSNNHIEYETRFGIPMVLARLEDYIFENLPNNLSKEWPISFMSAIKVGSDLSTVWPKFAIWLLTDNKYGVVNYVSNEEKYIINNVADLYKRSLEEKIEITEWKKVSDAAAHDSAAAYAAHDSAAAYAAYAAAAAAADAAYAAAAARSAALADADAAYIRQSEKLIELIREC